MEKQELIIKAQPATVEMFRVAFYASGYKSYEEFLLILLANFAGIKAAEPVVFDFEPIENPTKEQIENSEEIELTEEEQKKAAEILKEKSKPAAQNFEFLAIIDGKIQRPVITATSEAAAVNLFREKHPHATIHYCKKID